MIKWNAVRKKMKKLAPARINPAKGTEFAAFVCNIIKTVKNCRFVCENSFLLTSSQISLKPDQKQALLAWNETNK